MATKARKPSRSKSSSSSAPFKPATERDVRVRVFKGHGEEVNGVAMPADGRFAITGGSDGTVRKWELEVENPETSIISREPDSVWAVAVSADGQRAAAGTMYGEVLLIDCSEFLVSRKLKTSKSEVLGLAFLADGEELVGCVPDSRFDRWNLKTGVRIMSQKTPGDLESLAVSNDTNKIVGAITNEGLFVLSRRDGKYKEELLKENVSLIANVCVTADGRFAFVGTDGGQVAQWDLDASRRVAAFEGHRNRITGVAVTPDGRFCVSGGLDKSVRLWEVSTGQCLIVLRGHKDEVNSVAITPDARRIASVSDDFTLRVWDIPDSILARAATLRKRGYINAKVVLLGDSGVGKSGLALRLWHDRWRKTETSHGMEIQRLTLPGTDDDKDVVREVWLWDLAGQPDYRLTHQLFMEQTSLALLVFDPQDNNLFDTISYWQNALRKIARVDDVPGILVAARCDRPTLRLTMGEVREWAEARGLRGPILTAAKLKTHPGAKELRNLITDLLPWDKLAFRSTMDNFPALKDAILAVRDEKGAGGVVVKPEELEARVRKAAPRLSFTSEDLRAVTGLLAGEGVLHALPYGSLVVLQPSWVNCYASTLVKLAGEADNQLGHVELAIIQPGKLPNDGTPRLSPEDERQLLPALVALFLQRALAWKQDTDKGPMLVFPNYVRLPRLSPPPRPGRTVVYRFTGPLEEIYCTLVVRLHYSGLFAKPKLYRQAADFYTDTGKLAALTMHEDCERGMLEIYFGEGLNQDVQAAFQRFVHSHLEAKSTNLERLRNYFCPRCKEEVTDRKAIDNAREKGWNELVCNRCDPCDPGRIDLKDVLERQFDSNEGEARADEAERRANEGITSASKEGVMVGEVTSIVFSADQIYRPVSEPDEGIDGEIEFRDPRRKKATGLTYRVQLKSGDSHLKKRKDGSEVFAMKAHYESLWADEGTVPVLLIIRNNDGQLRFMNATDAIRATQKENPGKPVRQIDFTGVEFNKEAVLHLRNKRKK